MSAIAVLLMVKNEENNVRITLDSLKQFSCVLVYDTGSTDNTVGIVKEYPNVILFSGDFVDFATSRNALLSIAERELGHDYFLLVDAGDQFVLTESQIPPLDQDAYLVKQLWQSASTNAFYNVRLVRRLCRFRYSGKVHEFLQTQGSHQSIKAFHLFQNRLRSATSSVDRWNRDRIILEKEVTVKNPPDPRDVFYLAQTYECLQMPQKAYLAYKQRSKLTYGFYEERFISLLRCGDLAPSWDKRLSFYMRSFNLINRAEPLVRIAEYYRSIDRFFESWLFVKMACELEYPHQCILFVDIDDYSYKRWHLLGIVSFYVDRFDDGKTGCQKAMEAKNLNVDFANLQFYSSLIPTVEPMID